MINFSNPSITGLEIDYVIDALKSGALSGDGSYTNRVRNQFRNLFGIERLLLTTSGTTALEMGALLLDLAAGDEVIVPSFTFTSTVNAFLLRGAKPVFCDVRTDTMNLDETMLESLVTPKTKAIFTVDYAGVVCEMDAVNALARERGLRVVEDAAQALGSTYKGRQAGTLSEIGCYSFHVTKNYCMGEGGAIILNDEEFAGRAEIIREKGTNRQQAIQGLVDKYTWHDIGSSYLPSDVLAALLCAQMERFHEIMEKRMRVWDFYHQALGDLEQRQLIRRPHIPAHCTHNAHMYYVILPSPAIRSQVIAYLKEHGFVAAFHYIPLHSSPMGIRLGYTPQMLPKTEEYAGCLLRLPLYADMTEEDAARVVQAFRDALKQAVEIGTGSAI